MISPVKRTALSLSAAIAGLLLNCNASAAVVVLDFEGLSNLQSVGDYYNGGSGGNLGVSFSDNALAVVDFDVTGMVSPSSGTMIGNFANAPTPDTVLFWYDGPEIILNMAAGFDTGFSFYYSSAIRGTVTVFDGLDGTGNVLAQWNLHSQYNAACTGDPTGDYCNWTADGKGFRGTAYSVSLAGTGSYVSFDNITFGSKVPDNRSSPTSRNLNPPPSTPPPPSGPNPGPMTTPAPTAVPEPGSAALFGLGLLGLGLGRRRRV
jgi:hypothetical protein